MAEALVGRIDTTGRRRTVQWVLQALLAVGGISALGAGFVLATVLPRARVSPPSPRHTPAAARRACGSSARPGRPRDRPVTAGR